MPFGKTRRREDATLAALALECWRSLQSSARAHGQSPALEDGPSQHGFNAVRRVKRSLLPLRTPPLSPGSSNRGLFLTRQLSCSWLPKAYFNNIEEPVKADGRQLRIPSGVLPRPTVVYRAIRSLTGAAPSPTRPGYRRVFCSCFYRRRLAYWCFVLPIAHPHCPPLPRPLPYGIAIFGPGLPGPRQTPRGVAQLG